LQDSNAKGEIKGGNLGTFLLLGGTPYQPSFKKDTILMIEDCFSAEDIDGKYFMRQLQSLAQREDFGNVKAVIIGRFQKASKVSKEFLQAMVDSIPQLKCLPVIANVDFGHTTPIATLPIGGMCEINNGKIRVWW
jgi:muramoyltetrapeptide carboxypeptidase LdcA involved in peptidoglycan recycling